MNIIPYTYFTVPNRFVQVYRFLNDKGFYKEANRFDRFPWVYTPLLKAKEFFKKMDLPSEVKNKIFLILNNKARYCYGEFNLMRDEECMSTL